MPDRPAVLIVEDDGATRHLLEALVRRSRFGAVAVGDGKAALQALRAAEFDLILLDLLLPEVDGRDVLRHVASTTPQLLHRIIVVTAASPAECSACEPIHSVWCVVRKPFELSVLEKQMLECVSERVAAAPSSPARTA